MFAKKLEVMRSESRRRSFSLGAMPSWVAGVGERPPFASSSDLPIGLAAFLFPASLFCPVRRRSSPADADVTADKQCFGGFVTPRCVRGTLTSKKLDWTKMKKKEKKMENTVGTAAGNKGRSLKG